jgi:hypothetical protein
MEPYLLIILVFVVFASLGCFLSLVLGGSLFLFLTQFVHILTHELSAPPAEDFLACAPLHPWDSGAPSDISCRWKGEFRFVARPGHYENYARGVVKSLRDPSGPDWLAFTMDSEHRRERRGVIRLKTSAQQFEMKVNGPLLQFNTHVQVWQDGAESGFITVTHSPSLGSIHLTCFYHSADHTVQAQWSPIFRPKGVFFLNKVFDYDPDYYPLVINNRTVATIADIWIRNPRVNARRPFPVAVRLMKDNLDPDEQNILIMMLGLSLYFDTLHSRHRFHDW